MANIKPKIEKLCPGCEGVFLVPPSAANRKFCSKACHDKSQTGERKGMECGCCGGNFLSKKDHGKWQKFCSISCRNKRGGREGMINTCKECGDRFKAQNVRKVFCGPQCKASHQSRRTLYLECHGCGCSVKKRPSWAKRSENRRPFCSYDCFRSFYKGAETFSFRGYRYISHTGAVMIYDGERYRAEHRIMVEDEIGRPLNYWEEPVLHIDGCMKNNSIENLYLCANFSEMSHIIHSYETPYPVTSNIRRRAHAKA